MCIRARKNTVPHTTPYRNPPIPYRTKKYRTTYQTVPYHAIPTPCHTIPYPYPALPYRTIPVGAPTRKPPRTWSTSADDIHTSHLTVDKQNWVSCSLVDTRRRTTVESAEARNESWRMARTRGVGLFRLLSAPICMSCRCMLVRVWALHARTGREFTIFGFG